MIKRLSFDEIKRIVLRTGDISFVETRDAIYKINRFFFLEWLVSSLTKEETDQFNNKRMCFDNLNKTDWYDVVFNKIVFPYLLTKRISHEDLIDLHKSVNKVKGNYGNNDYDIFELESWFNEFEEIRKRKVLESLPVKKVKTKNPEKKPVIKSIIKPIPKPIPTVKNFILEHGFKYGFDLTSTSLVMITNFLIYCAAINLCSDEYLRKYFSEFVSRSIKALESQENNAVLFNNKLSFCTLQLELNDIFRTVDNFLDILKRYDTYLEVLKHNTPLSNDNWQSFIEYYRYEPLLLKYILNSDNSPIIKEQALTHFINEDFPWRIMLTYASDDLYAVIDLYWENEDFYVHLENQPPLPENSVALVVNRLFEKNEYKWLPLIRPQHIDRLVVNSPHKHGIWQTWLLNILINNDKYSERFKNYWEFSSKDFKSTLRRTLLDKCTEVLSFGLSQMDLSLFNRANEYLTQGELDQLARQIRESAIQSISGNSPSSNLITLVAAANDIGFYLSGINLTGIPSCPDDIKIELEKYPEYYELETEISLFEGESWWFELIRPGLIRKDRTEVVKRAVIRPELDASMAEKILESLENL